MYIYQFLLQCSLGETCLWISFAIPCVKFLKWKNLNNFSGVVSSREELFCIYNSFYDKLFGRNARVFWKPLCPIFKTENINNFYRVVSQRGIFYISTICSAMGCLGEKVEYMDAHLAILCMCAWNYFSLYVSWCSSFMTVICLWQVNPRNGGKDCPKLFKRKKCGKKCGKWTQSTETISA